MAPLVTLPPVLHRRQALLQALLASRDELLALGGAAPEHLESLEAEIERLRTDLS